MSDFRRTNHKKMQYVEHTIFLTITVFLVACSTQPTPAPEPISDCPTIDEVEAISFQEMWESSPHANDEAEAFRHWDAEDPREIPVECAKCHSRPGFIDFIGVDGSAENEVDQPAKVGTTITCYVCHNEETYKLDSVTFPSGKRVSGLGPEGLCINCHQGRASTQFVNIAIREANPPNDDFVITDLNFINSHSTSAATAYGSEVHGAYEYQGKDYQGRFNRGEDFFSCIRCHDQHSLEVKVDTCGACHTFDGIQVKNIRVNTTDFDGDGDDVEGIALEIEQIQSYLYTAIQNYADEVVRIPIVYDSATYPYFFNDLNSNGINDLEESSFDNSYISWTPRLLRAAYNYNYVSHDRGAFAHNSIYTLQVLYDSIEDTNGDVSSLSRP